MNVEIGDEENEQERDGAMKARASADGESSQLCFHQILFYKCSWIIERFSLPKILILSKFETDERIL